jgi:hypothetical protein
MPTGYHGAEAEVLPHFRRSGDQGPKIHVNELPVVHQFIFASGMSNLHVARPAVELPRAALALQGHQVILGVLEGWVNLPSDHERAQITDEPDD